MILGLRPNTVRVLVLSFLSFKAGAPMVRPEPRTVTCFGLTPQRLAAYIMRPDAYAAAAAADDDDDDDDDMMMMIVMAMNL